ncbi:MFS transporter [Nisaea acidiphila]|uniref:MFS transporter n=1 Tax=Nisaea acidiphila TaxID=1862145 RepID=A0A9J7APA1_9PROT|nr:MFS transporter [Nisaea acidiphila]UUX49031.1 MFS transporter [Nisaea acidiphila]
MTSIIPLVPLLLSIAILLMGNGLQGTLLPVRAGMEAFGSVEIGILGSAYFLGFMAGCLYGPRVVRVVGHIRTFTGMVAVASTVVLIHALVLEPIIWWSLRAITGFCFAVLYMVVESWLNEKSTNQNRGLVFSVYTIINLTVITVGQLLLMTADPKSFPLFAFASILVSIAAVPVALTRIDQPAPLEVVQLRLLRLFRISPVGVVGCIAVGVANGAFWSLAPVYALNAMGDSAVSSVAIFMSIVVIAGAIGQYPLGRLSDRIDRRLVIIGACLGSATAGIGMVLLAAYIPFGVFVFGFMFGLFAFPIYALSVAHLNDFITEPSDYVEAASGLLLVFAIGAIAGPTLASAVIDLVGIQYLFAFTATVHILAAAFCAYRMNVRAPAPVEDHIAFNDAVVLAQTTAAVDPLSPEDGETGETAPDEKPAV